MKPYGGEEGVPVRVGVVLKGGDGVGGAHVSAGSKLDVEALGVGDGLRLFRVLRPKRLLPVVVDAGRVERTLPVRQAPDVRYALSINFF